MKRIAKIQQNLTDVDVYIVDNPVDLYYLTGLTLSLGRLLISKSEATLLVDGRYFEACKETMPTELWDFKSPMRDFGSQKVGFDPHETTYQKYQSLKEMGLNLVPMSSPVAAARCLKDREEIALLKQSAKLACLGHNYIKEQIQPGVSEIELARELEIYWLKNGAEKLSFDPIIAFGDSGAYPHYRPTDRTYQKGDAVLIDLGCVVNHYASDLTRVISNAHIAEIYAIVAEAKAKALELCKPGVCISDIDLAARNHIEDSGYTLPHGLGHGVGLDVHEEPRVHFSNQSALQEGMVITIEPGIYLPGKGGVRLEDTIVITDTGYENITSEAL